MKNYATIHKYGKTGAVMLIIYSLALGLMPLFHIHPAEDHHDIKGSNYHSHHIPLPADETDERDHENHHQLPENFVLESLSLFHPLYTFSPSNARFSSKTHPYLIIASAFPTGFLLSHKDGKPLKAKHCQALFRSLEESLVHFSSNTSPPLA